MGKDKRPTIAIMAGNAESEYFKELIAGFRACAKEEDINLVFLMGPHIPQHCKDLMNSSFSWNYDYQFHTIYDYVDYIKPDAIIVAYGSMARFKYVPDVDEFVARFKGIPTLVLGDFVKDPEVPHLIGGNYGGMRENVRHLVEDHGYRKIAFVAGPKRNYDSNRRLQAYKDVLTENGIPVDEGMIVHGNYTEVVEDEVGYLLDTYPDLEAIVFANDNMAKGGYRVCTEKDKVIGTNIAITGFDDSDIAKTLDPPLSSVAHSSFMFSYNAVQAALELCRGEKPTSKELPAYFQKRCSCGCMSALKKAEHIESLSELTSYMKRKAKLITDELFTSIPYVKEKSQYQYWLENLLVGMYEFAFEYKNEDELSTEFSLSASLKKMCEYPLISKRLLLEYLENAMYELQSYTIDKRQAGRLDSSIKAMQKIIHSKELDVLYKERINNERKMWFQPSFINDLINSQMEIHEQMAYVMGRLKSMRIKSAYMFFHKQPITQEPWERLKTDDDMCFVAYHDENDVEAYTKSEMTYISKNGDGILTKVELDASKSFVAYPLFSEKENYGMILCEIEPEEYSFMLSCSIQIGAFRRIIDMTIREQQMKRELEDKNKILDELSKYDELTKLYNRRGFIEQALKLVRENKNKKACIVYADVDHLKEINDSFGHASGDFAIVTAAEYLRQCMPKGAISARLGGDEFVSMFLLDEKNSGQELLRNIKEYAQKFNAECEEAFYVEMSVGSYDFVCGENLDISEVQAKSDEILYEEKQKRRASIKK